MGIWQKLRALNRRQILLLLEATVLLELAWIGLRLLPSRYLRRWTSSAGLPARRPAPESGVPGDVCWSLRVMARRLPGRMTCLVQAFAAQGMLRRRGYTSELRIGVAGRDPEGRIRAHAWVEHEGSVIIGDLDDLSDYTLLSAPGGT